MRFFLLFLFISLNISLEAQYQKMNFVLRSDVEKYQKKSTKLSLLVKGNAKLIRDEVSQLGGEIGLSYGDIVQVKLLSHLIPSFSANEFIDYIEYNKPNLQVLNDTLKINNNVLPVNSGQSPLLQGYTGKGVIFGLIDTGIDLDHLDFQDSLGNTRILKLWDQREPDNGSSSYGYGVVWDSTDINNGTATHKDDSPFSLGHGTHVAGIAVGDGSASDNYEGIAPDANIVAVAIDFASPGQLIGDAVEYIYRVADSLGLPCVINISAGSYFGSHDGTNPEAVLIDSLVNAKSGRALVCAAGNAGAIPFHLQHQVNSDTTFTWFKYNPTSLLGIGAVLYEIWADTVDLNDVNFSIGANLPSGNFSLRGNTPFDNIKNRLGNFKDTIQNNGNTIGIVETYGELQDDKYLLQIIIREPDSNSYYFSLMTTGSGKLDVWSSATNILQTSDIVGTNLPSAAEYPNIIYYQKPDTLQTIVSGFSCLPSVLTVGSYVNRKTYLDVDGIVQVEPDTPGEIDVGSSLGPNRRGFVKPDIVSTGRNVMSSAPEDLVTSFLAGANRRFVGEGGKHILRRGTSQASPVVAGVIALYLEKCPNASMVEIRNAVLSSAKQDTYTGNTPNYSYGHGKIDAFEAINQSNFIVNIDSNFNICGEESIQITPQVNYLNYNWSTGDTTPSITIDTTESIVVSVTNGSGCIGVSNTINIVKRSNPEKPVLNTIGNNILTYNSNLQNQWYFNNNILMGETDTIHLAQNNGDYFLQVTDTFGCVNYSDTITLVSVGINENKKAPITVYPNPSNGQLTIELNNNKINSITIVDAMGKIVVNKVIDNVLKKITINLEELSEGVYYLKGNTEKENYLKKVILLR